MHAECYPANRALLFGRGWLAAPHDPPHPDCQCGDLRLPPPRGADLLREFVWVEGIVSVWGRIEAHRDGLRAEHARVCALARRPGVAAIAAELGVDSRGARRPRLRGGALRRPAASTLVP
jgi:hypothetical protein